MAKDHQDQEGSSRAANAAEAALAKLRGTVLRYDCPTDPVGVEDWEALNLDTPTSDDGASRS